MKQHEFVKESGPIRVGVNWIKFISANSTSATLVGLLVLVMGILSTHDANAADATTSGELRTYSTINSIGVEWDITGDANHNAVVGVQYRAGASAPWQDAFPLFRVDFNGFNMLAGSIFFLAPGTAYDVKLDLTDADGGGE